MDAGVEIGGTHYPCSRAWIELHQEKPHEPWELELVIETDPNEPEGDAPKLDVRFAPVLIDDWRDLADNTLEVPNTEDNGHSQFIHLGENLDEIVGLALSFGPLEEEVLDSGAHVYVFEIEARGEAVRDRSLDPDEPQDPSKVMPFRARAMCQVLLSGGEDARRSAS